MLAVSGAADGIKINSEGVHSLVESSSNGKEYEVEINYYDRTNKITGECTCPYVEEYNAT